ncbi:POTRA domain-containing protein, partial [uncultured Muribaculum sp.]
MSKLSGKLLFRIIGLLAVASLWGCSSTKHVPKGEYLVESVDIKIEDNKDISPVELVNFLRQTPNHKVLGFLKLQLATYNMSGSDTTKWFNRWVRKLGQPPVIYDQALTEASAYQLRQALVNRGYMGTVVEIDTVRRDNKKKIDVTYHITTGEPHYISTINYNLPDSAIAGIVMSDTLSFTVKPGDLLDRNKLDEERIRITELLRDKGYYTFNKEYITFTADTLAGARDVNLTMNLRRPHLSGSDNDSTALHKIYTIRNIIFVTDYNPGQNYGNYDFHALDSVRYRDITVLYGEDRYLRPQVLYDACYMKAGGRYNASEVDRTYEALGRFGILRYVNIDMRQVGAVG